MPAIGIVAVGRKIDHRGAGAVAEEHAGAAVVPVEDARGGLGADHQRARRELVLEEAVGGGNGIDEARADRLEVERGAVVHAELLLNHRGGGGEGEVGRRGRDDDEVDVGDGDAGGRHRLLRGFDREIGGDFAFGGEVALADAGALDDPFVGGVDEL